MKRKLLRAAVVVSGLVLVGVAVLWFLKPWVPDIVLSDPGPTGQRIVERGVFANYFPAKGARPAPAVMLLGGSEGGIGENTTDAARALQARGFNVLTPSYFGAPGQPEQLELIALETFDRALDWLRARAEVDADRVAVAGQSKGAEAALLVGVRHPELRAVVSSATTSAVWPGIDWTSFNADSSWTSDGQPLPTVPYDGVPLFGDIGRVYRGALKNFDEHDAAMVPVERIRAPLLLLCGEEDALWPACTMARQLRARSEERDGPHVRILAYPGVGHGVFGRPVPRSDDRYERLARWGGTPERNNAARKDAWPKMVEFLETHLDG